jgi:hypothetical protein
MPAEAALPPGGESTLVSPHAGPYVTQVVMIATSRQLAGSNCPQRKLRRREYVLTMGVHNYYR